MEKTVYVAGTWDLLHRGHIELFKRARALGTRLVVAVNCDAWATSYKRPPFVREQDRLAMVQSCRYVDEAFIIYSRDNREALKKYHVDLVVHGDDWMGESYMTQLGISPEFMTENGISLAYLPYTKGISTSEIITRIRESSARFYQNVNIPIVCEIGYQVIEATQRMLKEQNLFFDRQVLVTQAPLYHLYRDRLDGFGFQEVLFIEGGTYEEVLSMKQFEQPQRTLFFAFGGGSVMDAVKMYSKLHDVQYITLPSTFSSDSIYSPVARLTEGGVKRSFGVREPLGIVADLGIIKRSPRALLLAGIGDLVSNLSAVKDWSLANEKTGEPINNFAYSLSYLSGSSVLSSDATDVFDDDMLLKLANGLLMSGLAMVLSKSSRPASGSEHLISHAIDALYPERATLHGVQVAFGQLYVERHFRKNEAEYSRLLAFFKQVGLYDEILRSCSFTDEEMVRIVAKAREIRNRYTILNEAVV